MLRLEQILGSRLDPAFSGKIHDLEHRGLVEDVTLDPADIARRRLRAKTSTGADIAIALPRDQQLHDGAVLLLEADRAIVVRVAVERWLRLSPRSIPDAIELGYQAGNLHWRIRFEGDVLLVALQSPVEDYLARLNGLTAGRRVVASIVTPAEAAT